MQNAKKKSGGNGNGKQRTNVRVPRGGTNGHKQVKQDRYIRRA